jgi:hypothetical protein
MSVLAENFPESFYPHPTTGGKDVDKIRKLNGAKKPLKFALINLCFTLIKFRYIFLLLLVEKRTSTYTYVDRQFCAYRIP